MFSDQFECEQAIGSALAAAVGEPWIWVRLVADLDRNAVNTAVTFGRSRDGSVTAIGCVPNLARYVHDLARLASSEDKGLFKRCVFELTGGNARKLNRSNARELNHPERV